MQNQRPKCNVRLSYAMQLHSGLAIIQPAGVRCRSLEPVPLALHVHNGTPAILTSARGESKFSRNNNFDLSNIIWSRELF